MAGALAKMVAVSRGLSLGRQRASVHLSRAGAEEGGWADAGVSKGIGTAALAEDPGTDLRRSISLKVKPNQRREVGRRLFTELYLSRK